MPQYFKTTIVVEVLSDTPYEFTSLADTAYHCDEGPCVGRAKVTESVELTPKQAADQLTEFHSDPGFFQLNPDGTPTGE